MRLYLLQFVDNTGPPNLRNELNFEEIVGESAPLKRVLGQARTIAPSNATVLVLGDTGTGKELIARAIHRMSARKDGSFIRLNCAAIPTGLLESELFGHEKGAFTGAISQKVGRLELADKGTLFLDEVGDIPLELQPKLLRVLQDQEFESWAALAPSKSTYDWSPLLIETWPRAWPNVNFEVTFIIA
jgi:formate hydrogenlyase transcriptional activator